MTTADRARARLRWVLACGAIAVACQPGPGSFVVRMAWGPDGPPAVEGATIFADVRVAELDGAGRPRLAGARVIGEAPPVEVARVIAGLAEVRLTAIPNGSNRIVVVEARAGDTRRAALLRYGVSPPFTLAEGSHVEVSVPLGLVAPPQASPIAIEGFEPGEDVYLRTAEARLVLAAGAAVTAEVSGFDTFPADRTACLGLGGPSEACAGRSPAAVLMPRNPACTDACEYLYTWDAGTGLDDDCGLDPARGFQRRDRCPRTIYVRYADERGVTSEVLSRDVVLDTLQPSLQASSIQYLPGAENVLVDPSSATIGTTVRAQLSASEPLRPPPDRAGALGPDGATISFTRAPIQEGALGLTYTATITPPAPSGTYQLALQLVDRAGNTRTASVAVLVETDRPVLHVDQSAVSYLRAPNIRTTAESLGRYTMPAGPRLFALGPTDPLDDAPALAAATFSLDRGSPAGLRVWADAARAVLLLPLVRPSASGEWSRAELVLPGFDTPQIYVTALDGAGNESDPVLIEHVWFVGSSVTAPDLPSAHQLSVSRFAEAPRAEQDSLQTAIAAAAAAPDGAAVHRAGGLRWRRYGELEGVVMPVGAAWDATRGELQLSNDNIPDAPGTMSWDGFGLRDRTPIGRGFDGKVMRALSFHAGAAHSMALTEAGETWIWNGLTWTRPELSLEPPVLRLHAMAYDPVRRQIVLFGGAVEGSLEGIADTWTWDGAEWTHHDAPGPEPRLMHSIAWDPVGRQVILFGGRGDIPGVDVAPPIPNHTWAWNGSSWRDVTPPGESPRARTQPAMITDLAGGRVILFGGDATSPYANLRDTWAWDGSSWSALTGADISHPRAWAFDARRGRPVLWASGSYFDPHVFLLDDDVWVKIAGSDAQPAAGMGKLIVYDRARHQTVLVGTRPGRAWETWIWDGLAWSRTATSAGPPDGVDQHECAATYHAGVDRIVLFAAGETWLSDRTEWSPIASSPGARSGASFAYDEARGRAVLFGGTNAASQQLGETWLFDGGAWIESTAIGPPARRDAAMAYDPLRERIVLAGGGEADPARPGFLRPLRDVWEWDGVRWIDVTPAGELPPAGNWRAVYHGALQRVLIYIYGALPGVWAWDGASWSELTPEGIAPPLELEAGLVYDPQDRAVLKFGSSSRELWRLEGILPAVQLAIRLPEEIAIDQIEALRVRGACGAESERGPGARLVGWSTAGFTGEWKTLAFNGAELGAPAALEHTATSSSAARELIVAGERSIYLQCRADSDAELERSQVALDYLEARVRYRVDPEVR